MRRSVLMLALTVTLGIGAELTGGKISYAQQTSDPRVGDLVRAGRIRVGLGLGSPALAIKDSTTGEVRGPALDLARALAARIGVELQPVYYPRPGAVLEGARTNAWDVTFLVADPARAAEADFSPPYMQSDFTYLVLASSSLHKVADADQPGVRIAVPRGDASDLRLTRLLKQAELVRTDSIAAAIDLVRAGNADAYAAPRFLLLAEASRRPGARVLDDHFAVIFMAAMVPKGNPGRLAYISEFIEEAKASGLVKQTIERGDLRGVQVAPAAGKSTP
jgi:polar amino acid transport system substrate-binding protein